MRPHGTTAFCFLALLTGFSAQATPELISATDIPGILSTNGATEEVAMSHDGRYVALASDASNLVAQDQNGVSDVFRFDRQTGERVIVSRQGSTQANGPSYGVAISGDGRYVAFESDATNLVAGDTNGFRDIYWKDMQTGEIRRIAARNRPTLPTPYGFQKSLSADGQRLLFEDLASNWIAGAINLRRPILAEWSGALSSPLNSSLGTDWVFGSALSGNGRCIAYRRSGQPSQVFLYDLLSLGTTLISRREANGAPGNADSSTPLVSADCTRVAFLSDATDLIPNQPAGTGIFLWQSGAPLQYASRAPDAASGGVNAMTGSPSLGIIYFGRSAAVARIERFQIGESTTSIVTNGDASYWPIATAESGDWLAVTLSPLTPDDRNAGADIAAVPIVGAPSWLTSPLPATVATSNGSSSVKIIASRDADWIAFSSWASNLVSDDTNDVLDVFVRDRSQGSTQRLLGNGGLQPNGPSEALDMSDDGRYVLLRSCASNLIANDTNQACDLFVHDRQSGVNDRVNRSSSGVVSNLDVYAGNPKRQLSDDGRYVFMVLQTDNWGLPGPSSNFHAVIRDRVSGNNTVLFSGNDPPDGEISGDGRFVVLSSGGQQIPDCGVTGYDLAQPSPTPTCVSGGEVFSQAGPIGLSRNGRYFTYFYMNEIFDWVFAQLDRVTNTRSVLSPSPLPPGPLQWIPDRVSDSGRFLSWTGGSDSAPLLYVQDLETGSVGTAQTGIAAYLNEVHQDGRLHFLTRLSLSPGDQNGGLPDVYRVGTGMDGVFGGRYEGGFE